MAAMTDVTTIYYSLLSIGLVLFLGALATYEMDILKGKVDDLKAGNTYRLKVFGQKIAGILSSLERECSSLIVERTKGGERKMVIQDLETEWIDTREFFYIDFEKEGKREERAYKEANVRAKIISLEESTKAGVHVKNISLEKPTVEKLPEGHLKRKMTRFLEEIESWKGSKTMLMKDKGTIVDWATVMDRMSWVGNWTGETDKETRRLELSPKAFLIVEDVGIPPWAEDRKGVASSLLKALSEKAQKIGADAIELMRVDVGDSAVLEALSDMGFERIATSHSMKKTLLYEKE